MKRNLIALKTLCSQYEIEFSFVHALHKTGLVEIVMVEEGHFIHQDQISNLERMIRLHQDLHVNIEGIDVVINLLEKQSELREELTVLKNRLRLYEND